MIFARMGESLPICLAKVWLKKYVVDRWPVYWLVGGSASMCGICGFITKRDISGQVLATMTETLRHRGPDDEGEWVGRYQELLVGLGHRRLSILDVTDAGHQPMFVANGQVGVVYNGEIYNFLELRDELRAEGYSFSSQCDTEVLLNAYLAYGIPCVEKLNGMFAFVLVDFRNGGDVYFVRDRMGQKPLYVYQDDDAIVFASELKAITQYPYFHKEIRTELLARYLFHGYFDGKDTVFRKVHRILPGHIQHLKLDGRWEIKDTCYWSIHDLYNELHDSGPQNYEEAKKQLKDLLRISVRRRLLADVPVGMFLSGGIDSSLISAVAQECSTAPIKTYCIGFHDAGYDESPYATAIASHLGTDHHTLYVDEGNYAEMLDDMCWYFDEPFADSSQIPTMLVSKFAKNDVTVVLSGDAGDELFCGYRIYDFIRIMDCLSPLFSMASIFVKPLNVLSNSKVLKPRLQRAISLVASPISIVQGVSYQVQETMKRHLYVQQSDVFFEESHLSYCNNPQIQRMLLDLETYLPDDILVKVDRASMRFSLECRSPLLDPSIVRFALALPQRFKYQTKGAQKKIILKDLLADYVPRKLFERPKKGFSIPVYKYLDNSAFLRKILESDRIARQGLFNAEKIQYLGKEFRKGDTQVVNTLWAYFVFQSWYERFMEQL